MKKIFIGFSEPNKKKIGSEAIKWWTNSSFSHVYIRFEGESLGITYLYQASHGMVHFIAYDNFIKQNKTVEEYEVEVTPEQYRQALRISMMLAGEKYAYSELASIFIYDVSEKLGKPYDTGDADGYVCSALVAKTCIELLGLSFNRPSHLLRPIDIKNVVEKKYPKVKELTT